MKKILGLIALTIVFTCCDIGPRKTSATTTKTIDISDWTKIKVHEIDDMEYHAYMSGTSDGGIYVVNHTKELLEVELLQLQIDSLK
jgi:hypothetical protein